MKIEHKISEISFATTSYVYSRAQILTWIANGTAMLDIFEKNASVLLSKIIEDTDSTKSVVVNFKGVANIDEHALDSVFSKLEDNKKQLIIVNGYSLVDSFMRLKKTSMATITTSSENDTIIIGNSRAVDYKKCDVERADFTSSFIKSTLEATFKELDTVKRLCSTPIIANGEFNSSIIISNPNKFKWISILLSDKLEEIVARKKLTNVKLMSASLRGAPFASILGIMNSIDFETIDHFGPKHKVLDFDFIKKEEKGINYIYIGDFVFGGTEIKIAKTYIEMKGSKLQHALVLGSLLETEDFENDFSLEYLSTLKEITGGKAKFKLF